MPEASLPFDPTELAAHTAAMRRLARRLLPDEHLAEDVVQDALVTVIDRPPRGGASPRAWLRGVVRNLALRKVRGEERRRRRERADPSTRCVTAPDEAAARAETTRLLIELVLALGEPFRSTLVWRYMDGLSDSEIATRAGVSEATVRTRVHRGLGRLRGRLAGTRRDWRAALLPLALGSRAPSSPTPSASASLLGALAVSTTTKTVIVAAVVVLFAALAYLEGRPNPTEPALDRSSGSAETNERSSRPSRAHTSVRAATEVASAGTDDGIEPTVKPAVTSASVVLTGTVHGTDRRPLRGAQVVVRATGNAAPGAVANAEADAGGAFAIDLAHLARADGAEIEVRLDGHLPHRERLRAPEAAGGYEQVSIVLVPGRLIEGTVVDENGDGLRDASVALARPQVDGPTAVVARAATDAEGRFEIEAPVGPALVVLATIADRLPTSARIEDGSASVALDPLTLPRGDAISGQVTLPGGGGVAGVHVLATSGAPSEPLMIDPMTWLALDDSGAARRSMARAVTDADGRFSINGLSDAAHDIRFVSPHIAPELAGRLARSAVVPPDTVDIEIPASRFRVSVTSDGDEATSATLEVRGLGDTPNSGFEVPLDARGTAAVLVVPGASYEIAANAPGAVRTVQEALAGPAGSTSPITLALTSRGGGPAVRLSIEVDGGEMPERVIVEVHNGAAATLGWESQVAWHELDVRDGRVEIEDLAPGSYVLRAAPSDAVGGGGYVRRIDVRTEVARGATAEHAVRFISGGRLRIVAQDAAGRYPKLGCVVRDAAGTELAVELTVDKGWLVSVDRGRLPGGGAAVVDPALPAGTYSVTIRMIDGSDVEKQVTLTSGKTTDVRFDVR